MKISTFHKNLPYFQFKSTLVHTMRCCNLNPIHLHSRRATEYFVIMNSSTFIISLQFSCAFNELFHRKSGIENKNGYTNKTCYLNGDYCIRVQFAYNSMEVFVCARESV